jgi:hypothetical protein
MGSEIGLYLIIHMLETSLQTSRLDRKPMMNRKHMLMMLIGCLLPLAGFATALLFNIPLHTAALTGLVWLVPLPYLLMMEYLHCEFGGGAQAKLAYVESVHGKT